jgi:two-component system sensor histidine kinase GlrK
MVLSSFFLLFQMNDAFQSGEAEFKSFQLAQDVDRRYSFEHDAASRFFATGDSNYVRDFRRNGGNVVRDLDSLARNTSEQKTRSLIAQMSGIHDRYARAFDRARQVPAGAPDSLAARSRERFNGLYDSLRTQFAVVNEALQSSLLHSLKTFFQRTPIALSGGTITLALSFVVALAVAIMLARTVTKPIQALKAGTEKVGDGVYETVVVTTSDEVADLTKAFNMMSEKLRQLDEMRMQMMSEISHEMRTPLQVIKAGCYTIIHAKDGAPLIQRQRDAVGMIHQATNRINNFVNSFLDIAKMEAGLMKFNFLRESLLDVLSPIVQEAQLIAQTRQIMLEFAHEELPTLMIDKERLSQVFSNLLSNALKYTPDSGRIDVRVTRAVSRAENAAEERRWARVEIQDSGVGIPESDLGRLFNKFYQAKNAPLVNEKGSGLGLALVKHVTEAHGGRVSVRSKVGAGSTFIVELPLT